MAQRTHARSRIAELRCSGMLEWEERTSKIAAGPNLGRPAMHSEGASRPLPRISLRSSCSHEANPSRCPLRPTGRQPIGGRARHNLCARDQAAPWLGPSPCSLARGSTRTRGLRPRPYRADGRPRHATHGDRYSDLCRGPRCHCGARQLPRHSRRADQFRQSQPARRPASTLPVCASDRVLP